MVKMGLQFEEYNLSTIDDVMHALETLDHNLADTDLRHLQNFNTAYLIITRNVRKHLRKKEFSDPEFLAKFDTVFARYYFEALQNYGRHEAPSAWQKAFEIAEQKCKSPLVCMALGVNAHVNNDIPQVLLETDAHIHHYKDFLYVNGIIEESIYEVIDSLDKDSSVLSPKLRLYKPLYKAVMKILIKVWRYNAWKKYQKLKYDKASKQDIERSAYRIATNIVRIPV